jgi:hypothetical protein
MRISSDLEVERAVNAAVAQLRAEGGAAFGGTILVGYSPEGRPRFAEDSATKTALAPARQRGAQLAVRRRRRPRRFSYRTYG